MSMVDVCLYDYSICNLEDGSILGEVPKGDSATLYGHLCTIKEKYKIKLVIMGFNQPLRDAIYTVFPSATIILHPIDVIQMMSNYLGSGEFINNSQEEVAAAEEEEEDQQLPNYQLYYQGIYAYNTKAEAIDYYRQWQGNVPLGIKCYHHVIRTIDYYHEEIFNYFEFKRIFNHKTL